MAKRARGPAPMTIPLINGAAHRDDWDDWVIALGTQLLLGKRTQEPGLTLSPVYELKIQVQAIPQKNGQAALSRNFSVAPLLFLTQLRTLGLPTDTPTIAVSGLSKIERRMLGQSVAACEDLLRAMRASDAGIQVAGELPKG
jgi:hypothetical protein